MDLSKHDKSRRVDSLAYAMSARRSVVFAVLIVVVSLLSVVTLTLTILYAAFS
jgi:hypothetical protein